MTEWEYHPAPDIDQTFVEQLQDFPRQPQMLHYALRSLAALLLRGWMRVYHRLRVVGRKNLPADGSFVLVCNHTSHLDTLAMLCSIDLPRIHRAFPAAAADYFFSSVPRSAVSAILINALPFDRKLKGAESLRVCAELLANPGNILILFPEVTFNRRKFMAAVKRKVKEYGYVSIVVSEGVRDRSGKFLSDQGLVDAFGHAQLGGVAPVIANMIKEDTGFKYHWGVADYMQRAARHIASKTDVDQAWALGRAAVELALAGKNSVMPTVKRISNSPYRWKIASAPLSRVANVEKMMPESFITKDGLGITKRCRNYLQPLIMGEDYPPYKNGLPDYVRLKNVPVKKKLAAGFKL